MPRVASAKWVLAKAMLRHHQQQLGNFRQKLEDSKSVQREVLLRKIQRNANSQFGRDHGFRRIRSVDDFRRQVPVADYEYYASYVQQVVEGNVRAMFSANEKVLMFALTSGTTGESKMIPVTRTWMKEFQLGWKLWGVQAFTDHPDLVLQKMLNIVGNWDMRRTAMDVPCGMSSGLSARFQNPFVRRFYAVPPITFQIDDALAKHYTILRLAITQDVKFFATATPSTVIRLAQIGNQYREQLIRDVADGKLSHEFDVPKHIRSKLQSRIAMPDPKRARELERIIKHTGELHPKDYWQLSLLGFWQGGTVGGPAVRVGDYYGNVARRDIGFLSSEGRFTIPFNDNEPAGVLDITSHYYEFIPESEMYSTSPPVLGCHELQEGESYYIVPSTSSGLYRYNISDVVRCTGFIGTTPTLEFLHKGERWSDMEGEKVSEYQIVKATVAVAEKMGLRLGEVTAVPICAGEQSAHYKLLVEEDGITTPEVAAAFEREFDEWLRIHNFAYKVRRDDEYLGPPQVVRLPQGTWSDMRRREIARRKVGDDHYKHPCLVIDDQFLAQFKQVVDYKPAVAVVPTPHVLSIDQSIVPNSN